MLNISFSDGIGVLGLVLAIILVVLDKAGKVKGGFVFVLLFVAAVMTLFLALGNSWVTRLRRGGGYGEGHFCSLLSLSHIRVWLSGLTQVQQMKRGILKGGPLLPYHQCPA